MKTNHEKFTAAYRHRLKVNVARLTNLVEMDAPAVIIGNEVLLLLDIAAFLSPESMGQELVSRFFAKRMRTERGLCDFAAADCYELPCGEGEWAGCCTDHAAYMAQLEEESKEEYEDEIPSHLTLVPPLDPTKS